MKEMKIIKEPYSLKETQKKMSLGWIVKTESGKSTECLSIHDTKYEGFPIKCILIDDNNNESVHYFSEDGIDTTNSEKLIFVKVQDKVNKSELKVFQQVLVKDEVYLPWTLDIYTGSYTDANQVHPLASTEDTSDYYLCIGGAYNYCIPYKGNESLFKK